jgi:hypothetical protein
LPSEGSMALRQIRLYVPGECGPLPSAINQHPTAIGHSTVMRW